MKYRMKFIGLVLMAALASACTLSTTGLRPVADHSLAWDAITEVYDKPTVEQEQ